EPATRQRSAAVKRIAGLSILEPLNGIWGGGVAVVAREGQRSRLVCGYAIARKRVTRLLQFLSKTKGKGGIFVKDDPAALVILDEGGSELADGHRREPSGLRGLQHCGHQGETSLICIAHG